MVQIIHIKEGEKVVILISFISHMVQIIPFTMKQKDIALKAFISHMVQIIHSNAGDK